MAVKNKKRNKSFTRKYEDGIRKSFKAGDVELRDWYRDKAMSSTSSQHNPKKYIEKGVGSANPFIGQAMMFNYDPKHKETLPYYDKFPVIFPIKIYKDGWLGMNFHYLPPLYRARLMDALYEVASDKRYDENTKLNLSYQMLNSAAKFRYFKPCIKRYLTLHVRSKLVPIPANEWDRVLFLPLARFVKVNQRRVWDDSIKMIMGNK